MDSDSHECESPEEKRERCFHDLKQDLDDFEIDVLRKIAEGTNPVRLDDLYRPDRYPGLDVYVAAIEKLQGKNLIAQTASGRDVDAQPLWPAGSDDWQRRWRSRYYEILPLGRQFLEFLGEADAAET